MNNLNLHYYKNITLEQAFIGGKFKIQLHDGRKIKVELKPGSYSGQIIRLKNKKIESEQNRVEETLITLNVLDHPMYHIDGLNLQALLFINHAEAKTGSKKKLPGPDGRPLVIEIPRDTSNDDKIVLSNRGLKRKNLEGDIIFKIKVEDLLSIDNEFQYFQSTKKADLLH